MKVALFLIILTFSIKSLFFRNTPAPTANPPKKEIYEKQPVQKTGGYHSVIRVVDGDTIVVDINGELTKVRLIGLDTPETIDPRKPVQCFGVEAADKAKGVLSGQKVKIETDPSQGTRDKYGRLLAYAFLPDGVLFNKIMIEEGYGHEYTYRLPYKYQKEFKATERQARELKKGLWGDGVCEERI